HLTGRESDEEVGTVLADNATVNVKHLKTKMIVLGPRFDGVAFVQNEGVGRFPGAVVHTHVDVRLSGVLAGLGRIPRAHLARRANGLISIKDRCNTLCVRLPYRVPNVVNYT